MKKFETYIALRYLTAKHQNRFINIVTLFSVGGIFVGVAAILVVMSIMNGMESEIRGRIIGTTAHITLYSFKRGGITDWEAMLEKLKDFPDVVGASPFIYAKGAIAGPKSSDGVMIRGIDPKLERNTSIIPDAMYWGKFLLEDSDSSLPTIVLGRYLAGEINAQPGDTVALFILRQKSAFSGGKPLVKKFIVSGLFESGMYDFDAALCYIPLSRAQKLFGYKDNAVSGIQLKIKDFYRAKSLAHKIEESLGFPYYAVPWSETNKNLFSWMTLEKWAMFLVLILIIAVAAFNIVSTLMMVVMEKTMDIGVMKAMGATDKSLVKIFLLQGVIVGAIGTILGVAIGSLLVWLQQTYHIISLPPDVYSISSLPMKLLLTDVVLVTFVSMALSILSAIYPAWRAAKLKPVDAIRYV